MHHCKDLQKQFHAHVRSAHSRAQIFKRLSVTLQECACCRLDCFFDTTEANSLSLARHHQYLSQTICFSSQSHLCKWCACSFAGGACDASSLLIRACYHIPICWATSFRPWGNGCFNSCHSLWVLHSIWLHYRPY